MNPQMRPKIFYYSCQEHTGVRPFSVSLLSPKSKHQADKKKTCKETEEKQVKTQGIPHSSQEPLEHCSEVRPTELATRRRANIERQVRLIRDITEKEQNVKRWCKRVKLSIENRKWTKQNRSKLTILPLFLQTRMTSSGHLSKWSKTKWWEADRNDMKVFQIPGKL